MSTELATLADLAEILGALADQLEKRAQAEPGAPAYQAQRDWGAEAA